VRTAIILICILALAATIGTIIVGTRSFEGIVVEKPYEAGLAWDETQQRKAKLGWTVTVLGAPFRIGGNELLISAYDGNHSHLAGAVISVTVSRPSTRAYDKSYQTVRQADGRYRAAVDFPLYGNWDVLVDVARDKDHAGFKNTIFAEKGPK
jgi:nitrogen fixation protein FixH